MADTFVETTPLDPLARPLLDDLVEEYCSRYADILTPEEATAELDRYPAEAFAPPDGIFLLLLQNGKAIAGGGFMRLDVDTAEIKRVWTHRSARRRGLAGRVLEALENHARAQGYRRIYLTTGPRQPEAIGLYLRWAYRPMFDPDTVSDAELDLPFDKIIAPAVNVWPASECPEGEWVCEAGGQ